MPTFAEAGYPDLTVSTRGGIVAPAGTPRPIVDKLRNAIVAANEVPEIRRKIIEAAAVPRTSTPEEFDAAIKSELRALARGGGQAQPEAQLGGFAPAPARSSRQQRGLDTAAQRFAHASPGVPGAVPTLQPCRSRRGSV